MTTNENQYYIYLRSTKERIPCTKEEFDNYYRDINAYRKKQQRHGRCVCPESRRLHCDMDCATCPFHRIGDNTSLDDIITFEDGETTTWVEQLEDPSPLISDIVADTERLTQLFLKLSDLMPEAIQIGLLREKGLTETAIADQLGTSRQAYQYRLNKVKSILAKEFPEFF